MKKNLLFIAVALCMVLCLTGCGKADQLAADVVETLGGAVTTVTNNVSEIDGKTVSNVVITSIKFEPVVANKDSFFGTSDTFKTCNLKKGESIEFPNIPKGEYKVTFNYKDENKITKECIAPDNFISGDNSTVYAISKGVLRKGSLKIVNNYGNTIYSIKCSETGWKGKEQKIFTEIPAGKTAEIYIPDGSYTFTFEVNISSSQKDYVKSYTVQGDKNLIDGSIVTVNNTSEITITVAKETPKK